MGTQVIVAFVFGVTFIVALLLLAIKFAHPTAFQYNVFRTVLSLAAAGVAAMVPGFIGVELSDASKFIIRAGGALAVFTITFFFNPARLAAVPIFSNGSADPHQNIYLPPEQPKTLPDGTPFTRDQYQALLRVWQCLLALDRAGEDLWDKITDRTLSNFADRYREAEACVDEHALFFSKDDYDALSEILRAANFYFGGKERLEDIRGGYMVSDRSYRLASPGQKNRLVNDRIRHQIQQNKRWLTRYRTLLATIRENFHESARIG